MPPLLTTCICTHKNYSCDSILFCI